LKIAFSCIEKNPNTLATATLAAELAAYSPGRPAAPEVVTAAALVKRHRGNIYRY
jgi:hypothetical protein